MAIDSFIVNEYHTHIPFFFACTFFCTSCYSNNFSVLTQCSYIDPRVLQGLFSRDPLVLIQSQHLVNEFLGSCRDRVPLRAGILGEGEQRNVFQLSLSLSLSLSLPLSLSLSLSVCLSLSLLLTSYFPLLISSNILRWSSSQKGG